jgi:uncharacterized membrane protein YdfJ with MMPL/SSD domain
MGHLPDIRKLQPLEKPKGRQVRADETRWDRFVTRTTNPDLLAVVVFCVIGLLIFLNFILRFPDLGALLEQYNQF